MMIECLPDKRFYYGLAADIQFTRSMVEFFEHWRVEINIHAPYRSNHTAFVGKEGGYALSRIGKPRDGFGGDRLPFRSVLQKSPFFPERKVLGRVAHSSAFA